MDQFRIDSHKLMFHPDRVGEWMRGETVYPVYLEISPSGVCNHRCAFCAYDYVGYHAGYMDADMLIDRLHEMGRLGVRSVLYSGEGEPLLHKRIVEIVAATKASGIDAAMASNGVLLTAEKADGILPNLTWLKISIAAGTRDTYAKIHNTRVEDFDKVIENMRYAAESRRAGDHRCTLGMQILLLPDNVEEVVTLAHIAKDIGMDYLVVKPYSQHKASITTEYADIKYSDIADGLIERVAPLASDEFEVIVRLNTMRKWDEARRPYDHCLALPFWAHISTGGDVWGCPAFLGDERFNYGNINSETFEEIWTGTRRLESLAWVEQGLDIGECRVNCRMDEVNRYLWELKHPNSHVNFI